MIERIGNDFRMFAKNGVNRATEVAAAFAMNDADLQNATLLTGGEVVKNKVFDLARSKGVQIQNSVDRQLDRFVFVHDQIW
ncbi:hypothetical protein Cflav_PD2869 [Pedosphaera parvula Ellin514]|uniref:Uncharacterized protein n=1 Tax=Pedosphaera parvula (strain Ellin514) TaxID=320771 RepID=B9XK39_PEDPL|nr:hypothetical protein Cflav_PD2869 [Pedosphaera parvula Ellin514]